MTVPISNVTATWSDSSNTYTGIGLNVAASLYSSDSKLINLKINDTSKFSIDNVGNAKVGGNVDVDGTITSTSSGNTTFTGSVVVQQNLSTNTLTITSGALSINTVDISSLSTNNINTKTLTSNVITSNVVTSNVITTDNVISNTVMSGNVISYLNPIEVSSGGSGVKVSTPYSVLCGGTTSTSPLQFLSDIGTLGQALFSNGPDTLPSWKPVLPYLGSMTSASQAILTLSNLDLTSYTMLIFDINQLTFKIASTGNRASSALDFNGAPITAVGLGSAGNSLVGMMFLFLNSGNLVSFGTDYYAPFASSTAASFYVARTGYSRATTSISFESDDTDRYLFASGSIGVYGLGI